MNKFIVIAFFLVTCCSCVLTEEIMNSTSIDLKLIDIDNCNFINIQIEHGHVEKIADCQYTLNFNRAKGGKTILFDKTIKNLSPQQTNEVLIHYHDLPPLKTNYKELIKLNYVETNKGKEYLLKLK